MNEYRQSYRVFPLWAVLLLTIPVGLGVWGVSAARYSDSLAGTPLFALFAYGLAVGYVNRMGVSATVEGVAKGFGPLPCGVPPEWVPREEIARVYLRYAGEKRWVAGVERTDGRWVDLSDPLATVEAVRGMAVEVAQALEWTEPVAIVRGAAPATDRRHLQPWLLWGGMAAAAVVWALIQSI